MGTAAGFQDDLGGRQLPEERQELAATQVALENHEILTVDAVQREH
jgi:hypothetical protein